MFKNNSFFVDDCGKIVRFCMSPKKSHCFYGLLLQLRVRKYKAPPNSFKWGNGSPGTILKNFEKFYEGFNRYVQRNGIPLYKHLDAALECGGVHLRICLRDFGKQDISSSDAVFSTVFDETLAILKLRKKVALLPFKLRSNILYNFEKFYERFNGYILERFPNEESITENQKLSLALFLGGKELRLCLKQIGKQDISRIDAKFSEVFDVTLVRLRQNKKQKTRYYFKYIKICRATCETSVEHRTGAQKDDFESKAIVMMTGKYKFSLINVQIIDK